MGWWALQTFHDHFTIRYCAADNPSLLHFSEIRGVDSRLIFSYQRGSPEKGDLAQTRFHQGGREQKCCFGGSGRMGATEKRLWDFGLGSSVFLFTESIFIPDSRATLFHVSQFRRIRITRGNDEKGYSSHLAAAFIETNGSLRTLFFPQPRCLGVFSFNFFAISWIHFPVSPATSSFLHVTWRFNGKTRIPEFIPGNDVWRSECWSDFGHFWKIRRGQRLIRFVMRRKVAADSRSKSEERRRGRGSHSCYSGRHL